MAKFKVYIWGYVSIEAANAQEAASEVRLGNWGEVLHITPGDVEEIDDPEDLGPGEFPAQAMPAGGGRAR